MHLANRNVALRSKRPELVEQEFFALLIAHAAIRRLMTQAADFTLQAAEDLSFIHAIRVLKRRLPASAAVPPLSNANYAKAQAELAEAVAQLQAIQKVRRLHG